MIVDVVLVWEEVPDYYIMNTVWNNVDNYVLGMIKDN